MMMGLDRFKAILIANTIANCGSIIFDAFGPGGWVWDVVGRPDLTPSYKILNGQDGGRSKPF
jgi:hypothetical protein